MRKIIYTQPDGRLVVLHPVINTHPQREDITEAQAEARAMGDVPADAINPRFVDSIPEDRTFRDAWHDDGGIKVHMGKARAIHRDALRVLRAPKLAALDIEFMRAVERGDAAGQAAIGQAKQALRDETKHPAIEEAQTPEELKLAIPDVLR